MAKYSSDDYFPSSVHSDHYSPYQVGLSLNLRATYKSPRNRKSLIPAYLKILINHIQILFLISTFDLEWPNEIEDFFGSAEFASNVSD